MKKYFLIALIALFSVSASAQFTNAGGSKGSKSKSAPLEWTAKYQGDATLGVFAGNGNLLNIGMTHGAMFGDYFYAGLSVNFEGNMDCMDWWNIAPLLSLRGYYPFTDNFRVFINPEFGASVAISGEVETPWFDYERAGDAAFEYRVTFGLEYKRFHWGLGFGGAGGTGFFTKVGWTF